mmetsp:Transcript_976/g.2146  ORF Transcript_976/g.2146 Transcript_976/m.2146 type:complete len:238 (+) Transcript_976:133-846(+)
MSRWTHACPTGLQPTPDAQTVAARASLLPATRDLLERVPLSYLSTEQRQHVAIPADEVQRWHHHQVQSQHLRRSVLVKRACLHRPARQRSAARCQCPQPARPSAGPAARCCGSARPLLRRPVEGFQPATGRKAEVKERQTHAEVSLGMLPVLRRNSTSYSSCAASWRRGSRNRAVCVVHSQLQEQLGTDVDQGWQEHQVSAPGYLSAHQSIPQIRSRQRTQARKRTHVVRRVARWSC